MKSLSSWGEWMKESRSFLQRKCFPLKHCEYYSWHLGKIFRLKENNRFYVYGSLCRNQQDEETITLHEVAPASSIPCPQPTKTFRRKLGDFFTLKKKRGLKSEPSQEGRPKKASIADLIRPLREAARSEKDKDKERVKEQDKENEKEKAKEHSSAGTGDPAVQESPVTGEASMRREAVPPRRALREGKSQSLILLSGSAAAGTTNARNTAKVRVPIAEILLLSYEKNVEHHSCATVNFRNHLKANIALSRSFILCFSALEFLNLSQERHRCVNEHVSVYAQIT